jgi:choline dehydrogenase-like flavoprotein
VSEDNRVVVIGSGPPGATAALLLARAGIDVLLLEAGSEADALGLTLRVNGLTLGKLKRELHEREGVVRTADPRALVYEALAPGGLSNHWSCAVPRFAPEDFADAERGGIEQTWPVSYAELAPSYEQVEPLLHIAGSTDDFEQLPAGKVRHERRLDAEWAPLAARARREGRTVTAMPYAYGADTTLTPSGTPFNSFVRLIKPELGRGKITAQFGVRAASLEWSSSTRRVQSVVYRDRKSGSQGRVACRAVVVAGGALNSAQVLLESKSPDFPNGLGEGHAVIGRYLHDHPVGKVVIDLKRPMSILPPAYVTRLELSRSKRPLYAAACMQWSNVRDVAQSALRGKPGRLATIGFSVFGTMLPTADDYVAVDPSYRGRDGTAGLELHIRHPPESAVVLEETRDHLLSLLAETGWEPKVSVWKVERIGSSNHYAGTCRMHHSPKYGVVDAWSRVHGVPNVIVADSSVFTTNPEKNPVLTSMALAARAAQKLAGELTSGDL